MRRPECGRCTLYTTVTGERCVYSAVGEEVRILGRIRGDPFAKIREHSGSTNTFNICETVRRSSYRGTASAVPAAGPRPSTIYILR